MFSRIDYATLKAKQKENFNFQKFSGRLANFGFNCMRLSDDWLGADFIAYHIDGETFLKVQLKGRLTIDKKYEGKDLHIAFIDGDDYYIYPHDEVLLLIEATGKINKSKSWSVDRSYSWPYLSKWLKILLKNYLV